ncbi:MAG: cell division protein FtsZ [Candidatus Ratteibacteria bacterium]|nr:cell division protein FtsZ [Candidatus Ratteibacteria bacterium]
MAKYIEENESNGVINVKVVGVGNAGNNIVSRIYGKIEGVKFVVFNTDANALKYAKADLKIQIGEKTTHGRGTGTDPEKGKFAANEDKEKISEALKNTNIVFLVAGLGGGTGTGSSPVIAKLAKENISSGAIVIAIVTTPFDFEGEKRINFATNGISALESNVDTLIHIPNQKLYEIVEDNISMADAFGRIDERILNIITAISDLICKPKLLDIDFADICTVVENAGRGIVGLGYGKGEGRIENAARDTINDPLIEKDDIMEARNVLISITGSKDLTLKEFGEAMAIIQNRISSPSKKLGITIDPSLDNEVKITLIATGIGSIPKEPKKHIQETKSNEELPLGKVESEPYDDDLAPSLRKKQGRG